MIAYDTVLLIKRIGKRVSQANLVRGAKENWNFSKA
jgi:hypothetical protein